MTPSDESRDPGVGGLAGLRHGYKQVAGADRRRSGIVRGLDERNCVIEAAGYWITPGVGIVC
jgi:hypothetical protein